MASRPPVWRRAALASLAALWLAAGAAHAASEGRVAYLAFTGDLWQAWTMGADGSDPRQVTRSDYEKSRVSWYPDGRHLLVNALDGRLYRVNVETGEESPVEIPLEGAVDAVLSPDGETVAFSLSTAGSKDANEIWTVAAAGGEPRRLTRMPWLQHDPQWSADGAWIYFLSGDGGQSHDIWRVSADGKSREQISAGAVYNFDVALAPDGRLAFSSNRSGNYEIYSQRPPAEAVRWTDHPALDGHPTWAPDASALIFHSTRSGALELWRIEAPGDDPVQLTRAERGARSPVWWQPRGSSR